MSEPTNRKAGRFHVAAGMAMVVVGLIALSPILSIGMAKLSAALLGLYVVDITMDQRSMLVLGILTAAGAAALAGGAWIVTAGYRHRRNAQETAPQQPPGSRQL
jgi:hypothetical protein